MEIRDATASDRPALRDVARRSLQASYPLDATAITGAVDEWYGEARLEEMIQSDGHYLLVVDVDGQVVGFSEAKQTGESVAELFWLHIDPEYRSENYGKTLFDTTRKQLEATGETRLKGRVLAVNEAGSAFYERQGLTKVGEESVSIDGTPYVQYLFAEVEPGAIQTVEIGQRTAYLDHENTERGSLAPFSLVYSEPDGTDLYGYWCGNCERLANAMDPMGRIRCDECGNTRKATRWDAAYL